MKVDVCSTINAFHVVKSTTRLGMTMELRYSANDPYAVVLAFRQGDGWTEWFIDRGMLADGLFDKVGQGDVRIQPHDNDHKVIVIELSSPSGYAMLEISGQGLAEFLENTCEVVQQGMEVVNVDEELKKYLVPPD